MSSFGLNFPMARRNKKKYRHPFYRRQQDQAWYAAHTNLFSGKTSFPADCTRLMQASNEYFVAGAIWCRKDGLWRCTMTAPILKWMRGMEPSRAKLELARRGCEWIWLDAVKASGGSWAETSTGTNTVSRHDLKQTHEKLTGKTLAVEPGEGGEAQQTAPLTGDVAGSISLQTAGEALRESLVPTAVVPQGTELCSR